MDITLKVTPAELKRIAEETKWQIKDIREHLDGLGNAVSKSRGYWEGEASKAHQAKYAELKTEAAQVLRELSREPNQLLEMAGLYEASDGLAEADTVPLLTDVIV